MKIKNGYMMRKVAGNHVVVPIGAAAVDFNGMITLNSAGAFLWEQLQEQKTEQELLEALLQEYDVEKAVARKDVAAFVHQLKEADLLV